MKCSYKIFSEYDMDKKEPYYVLEMFEDGKRVASTRFPHTDEAKETMILIGKQFEEDN